MQRLLLLVIAYSLVLGISQVFLKSGINDLGGLRLKEIGDLLPIVLRSAQSFRIMLGIFLMASSFLLWFYILSLFRLSQAFPLSSITFIFTVFLAAIFLGEQITWNNIIGTLIICVGVFVLLYK